LKVRTAIGHEDAGGEIVRIAEDERADLIVIATAGMRGFRHVLFGLVAEKVVRLAACPVLTVRAAVARA
jgi:nucleotide-binding universal stress UspA family protein